MDQLLGLVLAPDRRDPVAITTALHGAGGLGRTTLAIALCHEEQVITAFDDGILWVTLGERPNVLDGLAKLYAALTGARPAFRDDEDAANQLVEKLADKNCLIVIDDVWSKAHLRPFLRGGPGCARLITTRLMTIAATAKRVAVDTMTSEEAVALLTAGLDTRPPESTPFRDLAHRLGEWPLLLELARDQIQVLLRCSAATWGPALKDLNERLDRKGIAVLNAQVESDRKRSLDASMKISLDLLNSDKRRRYGELAIFPEDTSIPLTTLAAPWDLDAFDAKSLALDLAAFSLLKFDAQVEAVRLHDVIRTYLSEQLDKPTALALHARLVAAWGDPCRLPDAYAWGHLAYHLVAADAGSSCVSSSSTSAGCRRNSRPPGPTP